MDCPQCGKSNDKNIEFCEGCSALMNVVPDQKTLNFAGFWIRAFALMIDVMIISAVCFVLAGLSFGDSFKAVAIPFTWVWFTFWESSAKQATIGKRILGLKVLNENGLRIGFGRANVRFFTKVFLQFLTFVSILTIILTNKKQSLHDLIARTVVVKQAV